MGKQMMSYGNKACLSEHGKQGFSLIEILVTLSILGLMVGGGLAAYNSFNKRQLVISQGRNLVMELRDAQKRAQSGDKPTVCDGTTVLENWSVRRTSDRAYDIRVSCSGNTTTIRSVNLSNGLLFEGAVFDIQFEVITGNAGASQTILIQDIDGTVQYTIEVSNGGAVIDLGMQLL